MLQAAFSSLLISILDRRCPEQSKDLEICLGITESSVSVSVASFRHGRKAATKSLPGDHESQTCYIVIRLIQRIAKSAFTLVSLITRYLLKPPYKHRIPYGKECPVGLVLWQRKKKNHRITEYPNWKGP